MDGIALRLLYFVVAEINDRVDEPIATRKQLTAQEETYILQRRAANRSYGEFKYRSHTPTARYCSCTTRNKPLTARKAREESETLPNETLMIYSMSNAPVLYGSKFSEGGSYSVSVQNHYLFAETSTATGGAESPISAPGTVFDD